MRVDLNKYFWIVLLPDVSNFKDWIADAVEEPESTQILRTVRVYLDLIDLAKSLRKHIIFHQISWMSLHLGSPTIWQNKIKSVAPAFIVGLKSRKPEILSFFWKHIAEFLARKLNE